MHAGWASPRQSKSAAPGSQACPGLGKVIHPGNKTARAPWIVFTMILQSFQSHLSKAGFWPLPGQKAQINVAQKMRVAVFTMSPRFDRMCNAHEEQPKSNSLWLLKNELQILFLLSANEYHFFFFEKLLNREDINIKLFGLKYLINRTVSYFFWPMGTVKK